MKCLISYSDDTGNLAFRSVLAMYIATIKSGLYREMVSLYNLAKVATLTVRGCGLKCV